MWPGRVRTGGGNMILTTRTIGLLVTMAVVAGGAAWGVHVLIASAGGAGSDHGLDTNGNGKFEWLVVDAQVSLPAAGTWEIYADLSTDKAPARGACGSGVRRPLPMRKTSTVYGPIAWTNERYFFPAGSQTVRMPFNGTEIARAGVDGPYAVHARLSLGGVQYMGMPVPEPLRSDGFLEWNYTTRAYAASEFEPPVRTAFFTGSHADSAVDVDADGLADFLELTAEVHVNTAGHYSLYGTLSKGSGSDAIRSIAYAYRDFNLTTDDTKVFLRFRGDQIRQAVLDGPWEFALTLFGPVDPPGILIGQPTMGLLRPVPVSYPEMLCRSTQAYRATHLDTESLGARGYWTGNVTAPPTGWDLAISVGVTRGPDMLALVFEDSLEVQVTNAAGASVGSFQTKVYLASSGTEQSFTFSVSGLSSGRYTVTVILGPESRPVDTRSVVVTI